MSTKNVVSLKKELLSLESKQKSLSKVIAFKKFLLRIGSFGILFCALTYFIFQQLGDIASNGDTIQAMENIDKNICAIGHAIKTDTYSTASVYHHDFNDYWYNYSGNGQGFLTFLIAFSAFLLALYSYISMWKPKKEYEVIENQLLTIKMELIDLEYSA